MRWGLVLVLVAWAGGARAADPPPDGWTNGTTARVRFDLKEIPQHDGSYGKVELRLEALADHRAIATKKMEGTWTVLAYVPSAREFILGGQFEIGAWLPLDVVSYLDERTGAIRPSRRGDGWFAFAAVPSPDGRFVAFVGARDQGQPFRLEVLDVANDALYELGRPPAPPPEPDPIVKGEGGRWNWGDPIDGFTEMDAGIITFPDADTLRATYGRDTHRRRAGKRTEQTWDLRRLSVEQKLIRTPRPTAPGQP